MDTPSTKLQLYQAPAELQALEAPECEQLKSPFQKAVEEWIRSLGGQWQRLVINPRGCGLQGRMAFNKQALEPFLEEQFYAFWNTLSKAQSQLFVGNRRPWMSFFIDTATTMFDSTLMNGIEKGVIPHPDGKIAGTERAGMPGSLEDDAARAKGSMTYDLEETLTLYLEHYSSGKAEEDQQFMNALIDYLGLDTDRANALMSRVLDHHGLPNLHKARRTYGALLKTALGQCYGLRDPYWRTTPEEIIPDQVQKWQWPKAYRRLPLLDAVLEPSRWQYDPKDIRAMHDDLMARHPDHEGDEFGPNIDQLCEQAQRIIGAIDAFRAQLLGEDKSPQIAGGARRVLVANSD